MNFYSFPSIYRHLGGAGRGKENLSQLFKLGVGETIVDLSNCEKILIVDARVISLWRQPRPLIESILPVGRDEKSKKEV